MQKIQSRASGLAAILLSFALAGCSNLQQYSIDTPAMILSRPANAGINDQRAAFRKVFCDAMKRDGMANTASDCTDWLHRLNDEPALGTDDSAVVAGAERLELLIIPGIFGECVQDVVTIFGDATKHMTTLGYKSSILPVSGRASSETNADQIRDYIAKATKDNGGKRYLVVGYSKGATDMLVALVNHKEIRKHVAAVITVAGVINGTPIADGMENLYDATVGKLPYDGCKITDHGEVHSLTRAERLAWLSKNVAPPEVPFFSLVALPAPDRVSAVMRPLYERLSSVDPRNDSQVIYYDAIVPGATLLGYANADHWAIALPFKEQAPVLAATLVDRNEFPRPQLLEAIVKIVEGQLSRKVSASSSNGK